MGTADSTSPDRQIAESPNRKILHFITRLILGGAQENTVLSCLGQAAAGHEVTLAYGPIFGPEGSLYEQASGGGRVRCVELPSMVRELNPVADVKAYWQCRRLIREVRPDVVHTHSSKAGVVGRLAAWAEGVPAVVHTIHGLPFHPYQQRWRNAIYKAAERYAAKRCHRIVCVAEAMQRQALAAGVGRAEQYSVVYSGMDVQPFVDSPQHREATRRELGIEQGTTVVGTIARLAELKGHDDLLTALGGWLRERRDVRLMWVGDGWWRERLERRIAEMGLTEQVILTGLVPSERIPAMLSAMDLLVHPSYREGLPRALPQALLAGVPVVSYDCDGAGEVCIEGQTGRLVQPGDVEGLSEAVRWMVEHPGERRAMAERGRAMVRERFDTGVMVEQLLALYERVLGGV